MINYCIRRKTYSQSSSVKYQVSFNLFHNSQMVEKKIVKIQSPRSSFIAIIDFHKHCRQFNLKNN